LTIQHKDIPDSQLHEPKGVVSASNKSSYVSTGSGTGVWIGAASGAIYFENIGAPYSLAFPAAYTKLAPTTIVSAIGNLVTEATTARLTYVGTRSIVVDVQANLSLTTSAATARVLRIALFKNGTKVNGTTRVITATSAAIQAISIEYPISLITNDYLEVYVQNDGVDGSINVSTFSLAISPKDK